MQSLKWLGGNRARKSVVQNMDSATNNGFAILLCTYQGRSSAGVKCYSCTYGNFHQLRVCPVQQLLTHLHCTYQAVFTSISSYSAMVWYTTILPMETVMENPLIFKRKHIEVFLIPCGNLWASQCCQFSPMQCFCSEGLGLRKKAFWADCSIWGGSVAELLCKLIVSNLGRTCYLQIHDFLKI